MKLEIYSILAGVAAVTLVATVWYYVFHELKEMLATGADQTRVKKNAHLLSTLQQYYKELRNVTTSEMGPSDRDCPEPISSHSFSKSAPSRVDPVAGSRVGPSLEVPAQASFSAAPQQRPALLGKHFDS